MSNRYLPESGRESIKVQLLAAAANHIPGYQKAVAEDHEYSAQLYQKYHAQAQAAAIKYQQDQIDNKNYAGIYERQADGSYMFSQFTEQVAARNLGFIKDNIEQAKNAKPGELNVSNFLSNEESAKRTDLGMRSFESGGKVYDAMTKLLQGKGYDTTKPELNEGHADSGKLSADQFISDIMGDIARSAIKSEPVQPQLQHVGESPQRVKAVGGKQ